MPKRYIYYRCSTAKQDEKQQFQCVTSYLERNAIPLERIDGKKIEYVSGTKKHTERELNDLIEMCNRGDYIYVSELSRLGRSMTDIYNLVTECCERGVILIQCKDGTQIENESIGGKALLFALSLAAEVEVQNLRQRIKMRFDWIRQQLAEHGSWVSKSGVRRYRLGSEPGERALNRDMTAARKAQSDKAAKNRKNSPGFQWVKQKIAEGWRDSDIVEEFNKLHEVSPEQFCSPKGAKATPCLILRWRRIIMSDPSV